MSIFDYLRKRNPPSASVAKERLQIIISHERAQRSTPDYLPKLQEEILEVIAKYVHIDRDQVVVHLERLNDNSAVLELNITMPEEALTASSAPAVSSPPPRGKKRNRRKEKARAGA